MKIERKKLPEPPFQPFEIRITIESEKERFALATMAQYDASFPDFVKRASGLVDFPVDILSDFLNKLFQQLH